jgi:hypothetical protein
VKEAHVKLLSDLRVVSKRNFSLWRSVRLFLTVARNGIAHTEDMIKARTTTVLSSLDEITKALAAGAEPDYMLNIANDGSRVTTRTAHEVIQAAGLAFAHAILDEQTSELCRLSATHDPDL